MNNLFWTIFLIVAAVLRRAGAGMPRMRAMFQTEAGSVYNWHRRYDSTVRRYTQVDLLGLGPGSTTGRALRLRWPEPADLF